ncbi:hypothetical protein SmJEL517_g02121 [Synchytrium microbalum]|uniref:PH domain-containing protein n=1 Tax=Synchytrium microbalum TaxID=1806994 RepID=A0A507CD01_9FUNG|nr:uncharacterized protein SmJEL517_g02121 [Synchytrium microbalum]TPX35435.1 hypothetical protein SmJEL517_g02121 [Synchytrium microbalum]
MSEGLSASQLTSLFDAVEAGHSHTIADLLAQNPALSLVQCEDNFELDEHVADILGSDGTRMTGLAAALAMYSTSKSDSDQKKRMEVINVFLKTMPSGEDLNGLRFGNQNTALHLAASLGLRGAVISLMGQGALANVTNASGRTVLEVADPEIAELIRWSIKSQERKKANKTNTLPLPKTAKQAPHPSTQAVAPAAEPRTVSSPAPTPVKQEARVEPIKSLPKVEQRIVESIAVRPAVVSESIVVKPVVASKVEPTQTAQIIKPVVECGASKHDVVVPSDDEARNSLRQAMTTSADLEFLKSTSRVNNLKQALGVSANTTAPTATPSTSSGVKNSRFFQTGELPITRSATLNSRPVQARAPVPTLWTKPSAPVVVSQPPTIVANVSPVISLPTIEPIPVTPIGHVEDEAEIVKTAELKTFKSVKELLNEYKGDKMFEKAAQRTALSQPAATKPAVAVIAVAAVIEEFKPQSIGEPIAKVEALEEIPLPRVVTPQLSVMEVSTPEIVDEVVTVQEVAGTPIIVAPAADAIENLRIYEVLSAVDTEVCPELEEQREEVAESCAPLPIVAPKQLEFEMPSVTLDFDLQLGLDWLSTDTQLFEPKVAPIQMVVQPEVKILAAPVKTETPVKKEILLPLVEEFKPLMVPVLEPEHKPATKPEEPKVTVKAAESTQPVPRTTVASRKPVQQLVTSPVQREASFTPSISFDHLPSPPASSSVVDGPTQIDAWLAELEAADAANKAKVIDANKSLVVDNKLEKITTQSRPIGGVRKSKSVRFEDLNDDEPLRSPSDEATNASSKSLPGALKAVTPPVQQVKPQVQAAPQAFLPKNDSQTTGTFYIELSDIQGVNFTNRGGVTVTLSLSHGNAVFATTRPIHIQDNRRAEFKQDCVFTKLIRDLPLHLEAKFMPAIPLPVAQHQPTKQKKGFFPTFSRKENAITPQPATSASASQTAQREQGFLPNEGVVGTFDADPIEFARQADLSVSGDIWDGVLEVSDGQSILASIGARVAFVRSDVSKGQALPSSIDEVYRAMDARDWWTKETKTGFLSHLTGDVRAMRKRYFVLRGARLYAYAEIDGNLTLRNTVDLHNMISVSAERSAATGGGRGEFRITFTDGAFEQFKSDPATECDQWVNAIKSLGAESSWPTYPEWLIGPLPRL